MFELVLTFVLPAIDGPVFEQRRLTYPTAAACQTAQRWWLAHPDAELPDMEPGFDLLIGPSCRSREPLVG